MKPAPVKNCKGLTASFIVSQGSGSMPYLDPFWYLTDNALARIGPDTGRDRRNTVGLRLWGRRGLRYTTGPRHTSVGARWESAEPKRGASSLPTVSGCPIGAGSLARPCASTSRRAAPTAKAYPPPSTPCTSARTIWEGNWSEQPGDGGAQPVLLAPSTGPPSPSSTAMPDAGCHRMPCTPAACAPMQARRTPSTSHRQSSAFLRRGRQAIASVSPSLSSTCPPAPYCGAQAIRQAPTPTCPPPIAIENSMSNQIAPLHRAPGGTSSCTVPTPWAPWTGWSSGSRRSDLDKALIELVRVRVCRSTAVHVLHRPACGGRADGRRELSVV